MCFYLCQSRAWRWGAAVQSEHIWIFFVSFKQTAFVRRVTCCVSAPQRRWDVVFLTRTDRPPVCSGSNSWLRAGNICSAFSRERKAMKQLSGSCQGVLQGTPPERSSAESSQHHKLLTDGTTWDVSVQDSNICRDNQQQNDWKEMNEMKDSSKELLSLSQRLPSLSSAPTKRRFVRLRRKTSEGSQWVWTGWTLSWTLTEPGQKPL